MDILKYQPAYKEQMCAICLATGSEKGRIDPVHGSFASLFYCEPYLDHGIAFMLCEDNRAVGYVFCADDYDAYENYMSFYLNKIEKLGNEYYQRAKREMDGYRKYKDRYPAHLHIDILEAYTGKWNGTRLIHELISELQRRRVKGLMLGVAKANERAYRFYLKNGFEVIEEDAGGAALGLKIYDE